MGVEGITRPCAESAPVDVAKTAVVASNTQSVPVPVPTTSTCAPVPVPVPTAAGDSASSLDSSAINMDDILHRRRRTSIPPSFTYGTDAPAPTPTAASSERRWRSFDCAASQASSVDELLSTRIRREQSLVDQQSKRLRPRKRSAQLLRSLFSFTSSASRQEQIALRQMQLVAQVATGSRSLVVLQNMRALVFTMDADDDSNNSVETPRGSVNGDATLQRMLDGLADADQVLAEDSLHHVLELQTQFFHKAIQAHGDKKLSVSTSGGSASNVLQAFLSEFVRPTDGKGRVPCLLDTPTPALIRFEKLLTRLRLLKPQLKRSLDQLCRDTMSSFTTSNNVAISIDNSNAACIWDARDARDVMQSLIRELEDAVVESAYVPDKLRTILRTFLEQMVFTRLAAACYRAKSEELDDLNAQWREQIVKARELHLDEVGLPVDVPDHVESSDCEPFAKSIEAFNRLPHLVPSCVLAAFLSAVRVLYSETTALLGLTCHCISADVLLPLLVFVLSRTDLPHLHSQVYLMEHFAIDSSQEGSEAAYYLACLQAAMGYIMTEVGKAE